MKKNGERGGGGGRRYERQREKWNKKKAGGKRERLNECFLTVSIARTAPYAVCAVIWTRGVITSKLYDSSVSIVSERLEERTLTSTPRISGTKAPRRRVPECLNKMAK